MGKAQEKYWALCIYVALALSTFAVFWQVRHHGFVSFDDDSYIFNNSYVKAGLTREGLVWAFTKVHAYNWHPLTWMSHMLDCEFYGLEAGGHHFTNVLFHVANALLLLSVLKRMTGSLYSSAFVAAVFALHPLHVESVAWASERKDVLSAFFWMLTMWAYVRYVEWPGVGRYLLIVLAFCLGLLSKPMLVTLPFVLLLLDYWPLGRFQLGYAGESGKRRSRDSVNTHFQWSVFYRLVWEKLPFFILSAISSVITFLAQRGGGIVVARESLPATVRIANAFVSYIKYIGKMFWPSRLAVFYPHPGKAILMWQAVISALLLLVISICIIRLARKYKYLPVGWLWYLGTLVPVIGLVQVGSQAMADRYTYLPSIGIFIMVTWGAAELSAKQRFRKVWLGISMGLVLAVFSVCARMQVRYWQDSFTLYKRAFEVTKNDSRIHAGYGDALYQKGEVDKAIMHFKEALRINPRYIKAYTNLGKVLLSQGKYEEAVRCFNAVLLIETDLPEAYNGLGLAYAGLGKDDLAITNFTKSIELDPSYTGGLNNLAWILATAEDTKIRNPADAIKYAQRACELAESNPAFLDTLAVAYAAAGDFPEAVKTAEKAIKLAEAADKKDLAKEIQERLRLYKSGQSYREK